MTTEQTQHLREAIVKANFPDCKTVLEAEDKYAPISSCCFGIIQDFQIIDDDNCQDENTPLFHKDSCNEGDHYAIFSKNNDLNEIKRVCFGRIEITLERLLVALGKGYGHYTGDNSEKIIKLGCDYCDWQLNKSLSEQSKETIEALYKILFND